MFTPNRDLFHRDQVPDHFKELFIVSGYRIPGCSPRQCFLSVFEATNETLNFWTHFVPAVYFWYVTYYMSVELDFLGDIHAWPLFAYMLSVCVFPITSAVAHVFNTLSDRARHICFFFDYAALSIFTIGASIAYKAYIFPSDLIGGKLHDLFLPVAAVNAVLSLAICCQTRFMENGIYKKMMRICAFAIPYIFDSVPVIYRIVWCTTHDCYSRAIAPHTYQFIFAILAAFMYISHVPERLFPGRFDIVGHSHQLFHVFTVVAVHLQMNGLTMDMIDRRQELTALHSIPAPGTSLVLLLVVFTLDIIVLGIYIYKIYDVKPNNPTWKNLYGDKKYHQVNGNYLSKSLNNLTQEYRSSGDHSKGE